MEIDVKQLSNGTVDSISIDEELTFDKQLLENTELLDLKKVNVLGYLSNLGDSFYLDIDIKGTMVLPCAITLEPVDYPFNTKIEGTIDELFEEIDIFDKKVNNLLDIFPIIWENILMEIPMRVVSENAKPLTEGKGWKLITDDEEKTVNHNFDKLNELL